MTVRLAGGLLGLACGAALAQPPAVPTPATPVHTTPLGTAVPPDWTAEVTPGGKADATAAFPKALASARTALGSARDYTATLVRQERVNGTLLPEQACAVTARVKPAAISLTVTAPKPFAGQSTSWQASRGSLVRHRPAGPEGTQLTRTLPADAPAVLAGARHPVSGYGLAAVLDRIDGVVKAQQLGHRPMEVLAADYTFDGKPVTRYEVFAERPTADGPRRLVVCFDAATKLPVRYEAYGPATPAAPGGAVLEVVSFVNLKLNAGVADEVFER